MEKNHLRRFGKLRGQLSKILISETPQVVFVHTYIRPYFRFMVSLHRLNRSDLDKAIRFSNLQTFQLRGIGTILLQIQEIAIFAAEELQPTFVPWEAPGIQLSTVTVSSRMILT